jgi:nitrogen permease regulator 3-like protein
VLTLSQVRKFAQHFIFWRRAMAIPPLHARDVYIVSPNCDVGRLSQDSQEWQRLFPVAPPLPNFLGELSQAPRSYKHLCPSKAHRPTYLLMLAWLMRRGWVTQLCTFAYVLVWPEIIYEVDYAIEAEELGQAREQSSVSSLREMAENQPSSSVTNTAEGSQSAQDLLQPSPTATETTAAVPIATVEESAEQARLERIATKAQREATEKAITHNRRVVPTATAHPSLNDAPHLKGLTPHIILDAKKATGKESRYLSAISERFKDPKLKSAWQNFCKYFDGRSALERVALQEDMKRKEAWNLLTSMTEYLMTTRHW